MAKHGINWKYQIGKVTDYKVLSEIESFCKARREQLWKLDELQKITHLKSLPVGTTLLVKFWQLAGQQVELVKHGHKYAHIKASDGRTWKYPYRGLTDKIDDKLEKMTAQTNQMFQGVFTKVFKEVEEKGT
jgi:hypothetical protein